MPQKQIVHAPHRVLGAAAKEVAPEDIARAEIQRLILDMKTALSRAPDGVGLAAPQVGVGVRIFLISEEAKEIDSDRAARHPAMSTHAKPSAAKKFEYYVFINPVLKRKSQKRIEMAEGCLSLPRKFGIVPRAEKVWLSWFDESGRKHERGFTKFFARVIQHELDHLDGILILDRAYRLYDSSGKIVKRTA